MLETIRELAADRLQQLDGVDGCLTATPKRYGG